MQAHIVSGVVALIAFLTCPALLAQPALAAAPGAPLATDAFGVQELFPTKQGGKEWTAAWNNGHSRRFVNAADPDDPWFDTDHGEGHYRIDGKGTLTARGRYVRMYVHDPDKQREWDENLEITVYITRVMESRHLSYSGLQVFARTNHGTIGDENVNICDDRGYGGKVTVDGRWEFEKETHHEGPNGYASVGTANPWLQLPKRTKVGVKYVLRNIENNTKVKVEMYRDLTAGLNGGTWQKLTEFVDDGTNWGVGADAPAPGVPPELQLIRDLVLPCSETKKPMITVYFRHEYGAMKYEKASIREIDALP